MKKNLIIVSLLSAIIIFSLVNTSAWAYTDTNEGPFTIRTRVKGDSFKEPDGKTKQATDNFSAAEMSAVVGAFKYWNERLGTTQPPGIVVSLAKVITGTGSAYNWTPYTKRANPDTYYYLVGIEPDGKKLWPVQSSYDYHTEIVFNVNYTATPTRLLLDDNSITSTITHELMHGLGMLGPLYQAEKKTNPTDPWYIDIQTAWAGGLPGGLIGIYDITGKKATQGAEVKRSATPGTDKYFYMQIAGANPSADASKPFFATFKGPNVNALTNNNGLPLMGGKEDTYILDDANVLGHPALLGSIMSYSPIRNMLFTEIELAALKDIGYNINLSDFFGKSYTPSNLGKGLTKFTLPGATNLKIGYGYLAETELTTTNTLGYGTASSPKTASYGTGVHVYRDKLNLTQAGDIYTTGYGAGGIRIDGSQNTVTIAKGTTVSANGVNGTGLLVSYGSDNVINLNGTLQATGAGGIAAHFGIGMADSAYTFTPYFTSYYTKETLKADGTPAFANSDDLYFYTKINYDLSGALVNKFNITGTLKGPTAIQIDKDVHVKEINVLNGGAIQGDIISKWDPWKIIHIPTGSERNYITTLNFGVTSTGLADPTFSTRMDGNIDGKYGLIINTVGGRTSLNTPIGGGIYALSLNVDTGSILCGNHKIYIPRLLADNITPNTGRFINRGTWAPGNSIGSAYVDGDFANYGVVQLEFNDHAQTDSIQITGSFTNNPGGGIAITPAKDYYRGTLNLPALTNMISIGSGTLPNATFEAPDSPTLKFLFAENPDNTFLISTVRDSDIYERFSDDEDSRSIGSVLDKIDDIAEGDMQNLFAALDFSAKDGSDITKALDELSPATYQNAAQASLDSNRMLSGIIIWNMITRAAFRNGQKALSSGDTFQGWQGFVVPYGGFQAQSTSSNMLGSNVTEEGLLGGFERTLHNGLTTGVHVSYGYRNTEILTQRKSTAQINTIQLGAHGILRPGDYWNGAYIYGLGRIGLESTRMQRNVLIGSYARTAESDWTGFIGTASIGGGYEWSGGCVKFGPLAGLDYGYLFRPDIVENGGASLVLDQANYNSLRSAVGGQVRSTTKWKDMLVQAGLTARWMHELLDNKSTLTAAFVGYESYKFDTFLQSGRDSLAVQGDLSFLLTETTRITGFVSTELFREQYIGFMGGFMFNWEF